MNLAKLAGKSPRIFNTTADRNDNLVPAQENLEWVTPKISLMGAEDTDGKPFGTDETKYVFGPSWLILSQTPPPLQKLVSGKGL